MAQTRIDRQRDFSGTRQAPPALAVDAGRLARHLAGAVEGFRGPLTVRQFRGGQSNPTYLLDAASGRYVLRRKPPGRLLPSAHAVEREYRITAALCDAGFPVARPLCLCEDESVIGSVFYVMRWMDGRIFWEPHLPGSDPGERAAVYDAINEVIARLHTLDFAAAGLADFGRPEGYVARQIRRWSQQYDASRTRDVPEMDRLMEWLPATVPADCGAAVVHGDFRIDNVILARDAPRVAAVLDWELSTIGDPAGDFAFHLMTWLMPQGLEGAGTATLAGHDLDALGIPALERYIAAYCERTGRAGIDHLDFYFAYNFFRLAAILQGIAGRARDGTAASETAAATEAQVRPLATAALRFAERAGMDA